MRAGGRENRNNCVEPARRPSGRHALAAHSYSRTHSRYAGRALACERGRCGFGKVEWSSQLLQNAPLHPIAEWGRVRFGGADVPAERPLADLESSLAQVKLDPGENVPLLATLPHMPLPKERALTVVLEELRRRQLAAMTNWVLAGAKVQPVVDPR